MKQSMVVFLGVLMASVWGGPISVSAQQAKAEKKTNMSEDKGKEGASSAVTLFNQAASLVSYARDNESAVAMLAAVQMIRRVRLQEDKERFSAMESKGGKDVKEEAADAAATLDPQKLLLEAKPWAKGNKPLTDLIDAEMKKAAAATGGTLGLVGGSRYDVFRIRPGEIHTFTLTFRGGEVAAVGLSGNGRSDLDLYVFDENGNLIGRDVDRTDACRVVWTPGWTGPFTVMVKNEGRRRNVYTIVTN